MIDEVDKRAVTTRKQKLSTVQGSVLIYRDTLRPKIVLRFLYFLEPQMRKITQQVEPHVEVGETS